MIKVYSLGCPKCKVIEKKLKQLGLNFELINDPDEVIKFGQEHSMNTMPIVVVNDNIMNFEDANKWISTRG